MQSYMLLCFATLTSDTTTDHHNRKSYRLRQIAGIYRASHLQSFTQIHPRWSFAINFYIRCSPRKRWRRGCSASFALCALRFSTCLKPRTISNTQSPEHVEVKINNDRLCSHHCSHGGQSATARSLVRTPCYKEDTLMGLPTELRLLIYEFATQDIIDTIVAISSSSLPLPTNIYPSWALLPTLGSTVPCARKASISTGRC